MPNFYSLAEVQNISWTNINKIFAKHQNRVKTEYKQTRKPVLRDATFYSIVISKIKQDGRGDGMLDFYNTLFSSLSSQLNESQKKLVHKTIYNILTEVDKNYLNFIGELAVLNEMLKTRKYELKNVEEKIKSNSDKSADFLFVENGTGLELLIEVVNIHLESWELKDEVCVLNHITSKVTEKIKNKFSETRRPFSLQPVIWTRHINDIYFLKEIYNRKKVLPENVNSPFVYYSLKETTYEHHFEKLSD